MGWPFGNVKGGLVDGGYSQRRWPCTKNWALPEGGFRRDHTEAEAKVFDEYSTKSIHWYVADWPSEVE